MSDKASVQIEAFVDCGEWRWRFYTADVPGVVLMGYQEWHEATNSWTSKEVGTPSFGPDEIEAVCNALKMFTATNSNP